LPSVKILGWKNIDTRTVSLEKLQDLNLPILEDINADPGQ